MNTQDILESGGSFTRTKESKVVVTGWRIPNGSDYRNATVVTIFYDDAEAGRRFAKHWDAPPEMAGASDLFEPAIDKLYPIVTKDVTEILDILRRNGKTTLTYGRGDFSDTYAKVGETEEAYETRVTHQLLSVGALVCFGNSAVIVSLDYNHSPIT